MPTVNPCKPCIYNSTRHGPALGHFSCHRAKQSFYPLFCPFPAVWHGNYYNFVAPIPISAKANLTSARMQIIPRMHLPYTHTPQSSNTQYLSRGMIPPLSTVAKLLLHTVVRSSETATAYSCMHLRLGPRIRAYQTTSPLARRPAASRHHASSKQATGPAPKHDPASYRPTDPGGLPRGGT